MTNNAVVTVRGLVKRYGERTVVDGIDLHVDAGEVVGLIGANGAGKTTTVECIQGLRHPDAGQVRVLGLDPRTRGSELRRLVGSQLQESGLPDRVRVCEAVDLFAARPGPYGAQLLREFHLHGRRRSFFGSLSGGEKQRLFLVLALLNRPRLVILDELTQGLDPSARRNVWDAVRQLREQGTTVLLVTHELDEAQALCDRVVAMRDGRVLDSGRPQQLVDRHAPWAVVRFTATDAVRRDLERRLGLLPGVERVDRGPSGQVTVQGRRPAIAHVAAMLVDAGAVPDDLSVQMPTLDDALVGLLTGVPAADPTTSPHLLTGALR